MSIRNFVSGSSVLLFGWLAATFINEVPCQRYPNARQTTMSAQRPAVNAIEALIELPSSASR